MSPENAIKAQESTHDVVSEMLRSGKDTEKIVRSIVDAIRGGTVGQSCIDDQTLSLPTDTPRDIWEALKIERTALNAVLLEDVWRLFKVESAQSETGLMEFWADKRKLVTIDSLRQSPDALSAIAKSTRNMILGVMNLWRLEREAAVESGDTAIDRAYRRIGTMNGFAHEHDIHGMDVSGVLGHGFSGVQQIGYGVSRAIPEVYQRQFGEKISAADYARILRGSYAKFFVRPAHLDKSVGIPLMNAGFSHCSSDGAGLLMDPALLTVQDSSLALKREYVCPALATKAMETQVGCPALYAKDHETDKNVNRAYFENFVGLVEEHHISRYPVS